MTDLILNSDQQNAAHDFAMFCSSPLTEFVISGPAGTGKTSLLRHLFTSKDHIKVAQILGRPVINKWAFAATTNKAAEVLSRSIGTDAGTIHSLLGLRVYDDYVTGKTKISLKGDAEVIHDTVLVVDEASMIDRDLRRYVLSQTMNCKIVYVGDHCQLAPIGEDISGVFTENEMTELKTIVRSQHTPAITNLANQLRMTVETGVFTPIEAVPGVIEYLTPEQAADEIHEQFVVRDGSHARIMAYTNKTVIGLNSWIRERRGLPETFTVGEHIISNQATPYWDNLKKMTRVEQEIDVLHAGEPYTDEIRINGEKIELRAYDITTHDGALRVCLEPQRLTAIINALRGHAKKGELPWGPYFETQKRYADLRPRDACTVHKAQGSTYDTAFVHLADIGTCTNAAQAARMLYVACSRPTHRICLIGQLPDRFRGG